MKKILFALAVILTSLGCSKLTWIAKIYVVRAEDTASKAHAMRIDKKVPAGVRLKLYHQACTDFLRAYRYDPSVFTLNRIEMASDTCLRVEDFKNANMFRDFEEEYVKKHPNEAKYGDAGPWMTLEG